MATTEIRVNLGITADNAKALASINGVKVAFDGVATAAGRADRVGGLPNTQRQLTAIKATLATFRQALVAYAGLRVIGSLGTQLTETIDKFTLLQARLKIATGSAQNATAAYKNLKVVAKETAMPVSELANFFARVSDSVKRTSSEVSALDLTRTVALGLRASAASAQEAASVFLQFSQAINSGKLAGEEFRATFEGAPRLINAYSVALGISVDKLYEQAKAQELSKKKLIEVAKQVADILKEEIAGLPVTIGAAFAELSDTIGKYISDVATATGVTNAFVKAAEGLAENLGAVVAAATALLAGAALGGLIVALPGLAAGVSGLAFAMRSLATSTAATALAAVAMRNPLAAIAAGGLFVGTIYSMQQAFKALDREVKSAGEGAQTLNEKLKDTENQLNRTKIELVDAKAKLDKFDRDTNMDALKRGVESVTDAISSQKRLIDALRDAWTGALEKAAEYRKKAVELSQDAMYKAIDRKRSGLKDEAAQLDASIESSNNYLKIQRDIMTMKEQVAAGQAPEQALIDSTKRLVDRQENLLNQLDPRYVETAARMLSKQTSDLYIVLSEAERLQAELTGKKAKEEAGKLVELETALDSLKAKIEAIKDTDLVLKRVTLVEQVEEATKAVQRLEEELGKLETMAGGTRPDGSQKGLGYYGPLKGKDNKTVTENTIGVDFGDGQERTIPTLVPGLSRAEIDQILSGEGLSDAIIAKAIEHARQRIAEGRSVFAEPGERVQIPVTVTPESVVAATNAAVAAAQPQINPVGVGVVGMSDDGRALINAAGITPAYADGGAIKPPNAVDKLLGWFNKDEFILRAQAARDIGLSKLNYMNQTGRIPAFAGGGPVGTPINLYLPGGESFPMRAQPSVAKQLASILSAEVLKRGRR